MNNYRTDLLTKSWREKRLTILKRDNYKCTVCESKHNLQVHHSYYFSKYLQPWKYPDNSLLTLCERCHNEYHLNCEVEIKKSIKINKTQKKIFKKKQKTKREIDAIKLGYRIGKTGKWATIN